MGFQLAKPQAQAGNDWSQQEINALLESLSQLDKGEEAIHTGDPHYWLAHHGMLRSKSTKQMQYVEVPGNRVWGVVKGKGPMDSSGTSSGDIY